jgi:ubiquinone/menaquinone biosynthesis C-methylase UbiE
MGKLFSKAYDKAMAPLEQTRFKKIRTSLVGKASGRVLEIGSGTGVNFPYYRIAEQVEAIEPNSLMAKQAANRIRAAKVPINVHLATAENLPFSNDAFDTVVATLVFCTIPDPGKALQEIRRVSRPGAKFLLFEHVRMEQELLGKTQDLLTPVWKNYAMAAI